VASNRFKVNGNGFNVSYFANDFKVHDDSLANFRLESKGDEHEKTSKVFLVPTLGVRMQQ